MSGDGLAVHRVASGSMAHRAAAIIAEELAAGAAPAELAVLARVNSALLPVQVALTEAGIAHTAPLDTSALQRTGVRTALAYLRLGLDTDRLRRDDVFDTLNRPARKVKSAVTPHLPRGSSWSIRALEQVCDQLDGTHRERFTGYLDDLRHLEAAITDGADTARCLWVVRNRIGLGEAMDALDASRSRPEGSSHGDDLDALEQLATLQPDPAAFAGWLVERLRVPGEPTGVTLSTVHRVKGMEWPTVVVFAANQGLFPHRLADDQEEERRVFHVAITRCQRSVHVISDQARTSPFVDELAPATTAGASDRVSRPDPRARTEPEDELTAVAPTFLPDGRLRAAVGVPVTLPGGIAGHICRLGRHHVVVELDEEGERPTVRIPHGAKVQVAGSRKVLGPAAGPGTRGADGRETPRLDVGLDGPEPDDDLFEALRAWRSKVAARNGVPAYLVFHDRHLQVLAGRKPTTLTELGACPGIGPAKLERYGDDLLDLVADHLT
ncbi:MAG: ATP-dependent DNA helicase UvrD2 [Nitriliruptor sp.]|nr:MAG: ATP-dependent DNA helicase UvrD2 [Nitriliruptor sp.]